MGIQYLKDEPITDGNVRGALFLRRTAGSIEKHPATSKPRCRGCNRLHRYSGMLGEDCIISRVCNDTCSNDNSWTALHVDDFNCGAGDHLKPIMSCKSCSTDKQAAFNAKQALTVMNSNASTSQIHMIPSGPWRPPEDTNCSRDCKDNPSTV